MRTSPILLVLLLSSCGRAEREREDAVEAARAATLVQIEGVLSETIRLADRLAESSDRILRPLPVMTPAEEEALRRFRNSAHLARARALGVRVVSAGGGPLTGGQSFVRYIGYLVSTLVFCLGFLAMLWDDENRCWHDRMAGTRVIRT